jgi:hypothetical protein
MGRTVPLLLIWVSSGMLLGDLYLSLSIIISRRLRKNTYLLGPSVEYVFLALSIEKRSRTNAQNIIIITNCNINPYPANVENMVSSE